MAAAISCIRAFPVGRRRTRRMSRIAKRTAARPPATPNKTRFGSTNPSTVKKRKKAARSETVYEPSTEHAPAPPHHHAAEHDQARHENAGDEDQGALVLLRQGERQRAAGFGRYGDQRVLLRQPLERGQRQLEVGVAVGGRHGAVLREGGRADHHDAGALRTSGLLYRLHDVEGPGGVSSLPRQVLYRTR